MIESEIEKLKRLRLPKIKGSWSEIVKVVDTFRIYNNGYTYKCTDGFLIRYVGVKKNYYPYIYTESNIGKLFFRKKNNCFYIPGDCGQHDCECDRDCIFELVEIPEDIKVDMFKFRNTYNIKFADKKQYEYS